MLTLRFNVVNLYLHNQYGHNPPHHHSRILHHTFCHKLYVKHVTIRTKKYVYHWVKMIEIIVQWN